MGVLEGRVAVVTGSTRGLGFAIAERFAREGAAVLLSSRGGESVRRAVEKLRGQGLRVEGQACDVGQLPQVRALAERAREAFGGFDVWVNNAGVSAPYGPTVQVGAERFRAVVDTNILGTLHGSLVALEHLAARRRGKLLNLLGRGDRGPVPLQNAYASSKAWVRSFTLALAEEYRSRGVDVFAFNPGLVDTELVRKVEAVRGWGADMAPLRTVLRLWARAPEVPAQRALYLASSASDGLRTVEHHVLSNRALVEGALRQGLRWLTGRAEDAGLEVTEVEPCAPESSPR